MTVPTTFFGWVGLLLEKYGVRRCFYGHLHSDSHKLAIEGLWGGVEYKLVAADYTGFRPVKVMD